MFFDDDIEEEVDNYANTFTKEPEFKCPSCGTQLYTDWVDNGFGPYSVQASPYGCECGWHETGCKECIKEKCFSWAKCQSRALIVNPALKEGVTNTMKDPNVKSEQATEQEAPKEDVKNLESASLDQAMGVDSEEGTTEG